MTREQILHQVQKICRQKYSQITQWEHNIDHIKRVVVNGRKLAKMEKLTPKDAFLLELACWLHDLGRVGEETGLQFLASNHAEHSYQTSKKILKPFERILGRESVYKVLQAVREHNLPCLKHPENQIGRLLLDADRGAGLNPIGIFTMLSYLNIVKTEPVKSLKQARIQLDNLRQLIISQNKTTEAKEKISFLKDWYYGNDNQNDSKAVVVSLYSHSARKLFKKGIKEIEEFINNL